MEFYFSEYVVFEFSGMFFKCVVFVFRVDNGVAFFRASFFDEFLVFCLCFGCVLCVVIWIYDWFIVGVGFY